MHENYFSELMMFFFLRTSKLSFRSKCTKNTGLLSQKCAAKLTSNDHGIIDRIAVYYAFGKPMDLQHETLKIQCEYILL
jgi:hypothetical protein